MKKNNFLSFFTLITISVIICLAFFNPPRNYRIFDYYPGDAFGVNLDGLNLRIILFLILHYALVASFGLALAYPFFSNITNVSFFIKFLSSFFIGYGCLLSIIRVLSFIFPYEEIYWPTIIFILSCLSSFFLIHPLNFKLSPASLLKTKTAGLFLIQLCLLVGFIFIILIHQICAGEFSWVGHGNGQYAHYLDLWRAQKLSHFPLITKHYDELIFHYFLTLPLDSTFTPITPWWITLALMKASIGALIYLLFRKLNVSKILSAVFSLYMLLGTTSLSASHYYLLFDASNPIAYMVHSGRIAGIAFSLLYLVDILTNTQRPPSLIFLSLSALGLTATSFSNVLWIILLYILTIIYTLYYSKNSQLKPSV